jgi:hypothetical protein
VNKINISSGNLPLKKIQKSLFELSDLGKLEFAKLKHSKRATLQYFLVHFSPGKNVGLLRKFY